MMMPKNRASSGMGLDTRGIGQDLAQELMISLLQLLLDHHLLVAIGAEDAELEDAHQVLGRPAPDH
jgi:hypothetical protein